GLRSLVDALGGITVNNTLGFTISIEAQEPAYRATIDPGQHLINGDQALVYARMRYDDPEGDVGRQKRQREVIGAVVQKL
ncbi:LCP family protein, partial [Streptococcus pyogenes]